MEAKQLIGCGLGALLVMLVGSVLLIMVEVSFELPVDQPIAAISRVALYFVVGLSAGLIMKSYEPGSLFPFMFGLMLTIAVYVLRLAGPRFLEGSPVGLAEFTILDQPALMRALAAFAGYLVFALQRPPVKGSGFGETVPLYRMHMKIDDAGMLLDEDDMAELQKHSTKGFSCSICRSTEHDDKEDWFFSYLRCPHDSTHVFHVRHYWELGWRCPVDRRPLFLDDDAHT